MAKRNTYFQDEIVEKKIDAKQFGRILRYVFPYKAVFFLVAVLLLVSAAISMVAPQLIRYIVDHVIVSEDYRELSLVIGGLVFLAAIEIAITYCHQRFMGTVGHKIIAKVRQDAFYKLQKLPFDYFDSKPNGKIVVRVTDYINDLFGCNACN
jgi:ATP-binding cassette subfamily B protein